MSRIDEAMRQVAAGPRAVQPGQTAATRGESARNLLERYPQEATPSVSPVASIALPRPTALDRPAVQQSLLATTMQTIGEATSEAMSIAIEQYRRLAAELHEAQVERGIKRALVTSALPREGKTLTVTNLAITLSESYHRRVLLIDADLRRPSVDRILGIPNTRGLKDALEDNGPIPFVEVTPYLSVLPAGRAGENPAGALGSDRMDAVMDHAVKHFDWVLLDTAPVGLLPDVQHLVRIVDAVVFVIAAGSTPYRIAQRAVAEIGPDRILGTVLNRVAIEAVPLSGYYKDYYGEPPQGGRETHSSTLLRHR